MIVSGHFAGSIKDTNTYQLMGEPTNDPEGNIIDGIYHNTKRDNAVSVIILNASNKHYIIKKGEKIGT